MITVRSPCCGATWRTVHVKCNGISKIYIHVVRLNATRFVDSCTGVINGLVHHESGIKISVLAPHNGG